MPALSKLLSTPGAKAFVSSMYYTATSVGSLFWLLAYTDAGASLPAQWHWMQAHWWPFLFAQLIAPALRAHAAVNLYKEPPAA